MKRPISIVQSRPYALLFGLLVLLLAACQPIQPVESDAAATTSAATTTDTATTVHLTILHLNDVYEIMPVGGGMVGGLARIATLRQQLTAANSNTIVTFAGDLYMPSGLSAAMVDGTPLDGEQAVAVMNTVGVNYMTFGDHEFHISNEDEFYARLAETQFPILSSNVLAANGEPFPGVAANAIFTATNAAGHTLRVGVFGVTEKIGRTAIALRYVDSQEATAAQVAALRDQVDVLIAITHFYVEEDKALAAAFPEIDLIVGGDDHEHMAVTTGPDTAPIYKSDSNARNVTILDLAYDTASQALTIDARLQPVTDALAEDPITKAVVDVWMERGFAAYRAEGVDPAAVIGTAPADLDGFATSIRNHPTELTNLITAGMLAMAPDAKASLFASGFLRLDDLIPAGAPVTQYDILRAFPFDEAVVTVEINGQALNDWLESASTMTGSGAFVLTSTNLRRNATTQRWELDGVALEPQQLYRIVAPKSDLDPSLTPIAEVGTIRQSLIEQLQ
jgi:5'-nucleotidase/UDP-sugar diphosphatase